MKLRVHVDRLMALITAQAHERLRGPRSQRRPSSLSQVTLVNDNMQEFYVRFHGPDESASPAPSAVLTAQLHLLEGT